MYSTRKREHLLCRLKVSPPCSPTQCAYRHTCKSPVLQHCARSVSLTLQCPRVLQATDYLIGQEFGDALPPEGRIVAC